MADSFGGAVVTESTAPDFTALFDPSSNPTRDGNCVTDSWSISVETTVLPDRIETLVT